MADGLSSLSSINWGASTGGAAGSAESTLTLGVDRGDTRTPPDTNHVWGAQLNNCKNLLIAISATFKGGTRLGVLPQSSNPFGGSESGFYVDNSGGFWGVYNGAPTSLSGGAAALGNWVFSGNDATLSGAGTLTVGTTVQTAMTLGRTNSPTTYNSTLHLFRSGTSDGASAVLMAGDTTSAWSNATAKLLSLRTNAVEKWFWTPGGNMGMPANASFTGASSATNTTGLNLTTTVADGASSIGLLINNAAATTSAISTRWQNNGNNRLQIELDTIVAGSAVIRQPSTTYLALLDSGNAGIKVQSGVVYLRDGVNDRVQIDSQGMHLNSSGAAGLFPHYNTQSGTTYTCLVTDTYVGMSNVGARTVTLPAASAAVGQWLMIKDESCAGTTITINRAGSDTIIDTATGGTSISLSTAGAKAVLMSDGVSKWFRVV